MTNKQQDFLPSKIKTIKHEAGQSLSLIIFKQAHPQAQPSQAQG